MPGNSQNSVRLYNLSLEERQKTIQEIAGLNQAEMDALSGKNGLSPDQADHMVENVIGAFSLPLGVAPNFLINGQDVLVPMVIEEPSVIAGASFMAKLTRSSGGFFAHADDALMIGQIQLLDLADVYTSRLVLLEHKRENLAAAAVDKILSELGGGPKDLEVKIIPDSPVGAFLVVQVIFDVLDAMGANAVNSALEAISPLIARLTGGRVHLRILSNLADRRLARARCCVLKDDLAFGDFSGETVRDGIIAAWAFASVDPYRAATHNKGVMNGIDAVLIATGNDWRAVEAGAHAYAARSGKYTSLTTWGKDENGNLSGTIEIPMAVGVVGGATRTLPAVQAALHLMGVKTARQLAEIIASVGLAQNLAALRALATEGIQRGHMELHARQIAVAAGAVGRQIDQLAEKLDFQEKNIHLERARELLGSLSSGNTAE